MSDHRGAPAHLGSDSRTLAVDMPRERRERLRRQSARGYDRSIVDRIRAVCTDECEPATHSIRSEP